MYNIALNTNTISCLLKCATIIPIPKPYKDHNIATNYQPILLLSPIAKTLEKKLLPYITENIPAISHQHGFKHKHSTDIALHNICHQITKGFLCKNKSLILLKQIYFYLNFINFMSLIILNGFTKGLQKNFFKISLGRAAAAKTYSNCEPATALIDSNALELIPMHSKQSVFSIKFILLSK